jgi:hypothetical protein
MLGNGKEIDVQVDFKLTYTTLDLDNLESPSLLAKKLERKLNEMLNEYFKFAEINHIRDNEIKVSDVVFIRAH